MNVKKFSEAMSELDGKYVEEAANYRKKKTHKPVWGKRGAIGACFAVAAVAVFCVLPNCLNRQDVTPTDDPKGVIGNNHNDVTPPTSVEVRIGMEKIFLNELEEFPDAARMWYDPELYDNIVWDKSDIFDYYGKDLTPAYIPDGLTAAPGNGTAAVIADKNGELVADTIWYGFFHDYYEDGSPKLTEKVSAEKGFYLTVSKVGLLNDCLYILPENEVKTSDIGGTAVTFGYRSMSYGPYDPDTHEPSGYYDMYVAEFKLDGIEYQIIAEQTEFEEVVKIVASVITGEKDISVD